MSNSASTVCLENLSAELSRLGRLSLNGFGFGGICLGGLRGLGILLSFGGILRLGWGGWRALASVVSASVVLVSVASAFNVAMVVAVSTPRGGPELLVVAVCHLAANRGRDAFDAGAGPLRRWWPSGSMGLHAFELRLGLGLDLAASGRFSSALGGRPTRVPSIFWWRGGVQVAVSSASVLGGVTC